MEANAPGRDYDIRTVARENSDSLADRIRALDGLRGFAALAVLAHHCMSLSPAFIAGLQGTDPKPTGWMWWAVYSPLHLLWAGPEPVYVFFVLSGFVLTRPIFGNGQPRWRQFWSKRLVRLYIPAWASIIFAVGALIAFPRTSVPGRSEWHNYVPQVSFSSLLGDTIALDGQLNGPLWSLRYEVLFSLLVPLYIFVLRRFRRSWPFTIALTGILITFGTGSGTLHVTVYKTCLYLGIFAAGAILAAYEPTLRKMVGRTSNLQGIGLTGLSLLLLSARSWTLPESNSVLEILSVSGATLLVLMFAAHPGVGAAGMSRLAQWVGRRSFSLYLTHLPLIYIIADCFSAPNPAIVFLIALPASLCAAAIFYRWVERPAQLLANLISVKSPGSSPGRILGRMGLK